MAVQPGTLPFFSGALRVKVSVRLDTFLDEEGELDWDHPGEEWVSVEWFGDAIEWRAFLTDFKHRFISPRRTWNPDYGKWFVTADYCPELLQWLAANGIKPFWQKRPRDIDPLPPEVMDDFHSMWIDPCAPFEIAQAFYLVLREHVRDAKQLETITAAWSRLMVKFREDGIV